MQALRATLLRSTLVYRALLRLRYGASSAPRLESVAAPSECGVLRTEEEWQRSLEEVRRIGLFPHGEPTKNWDCLAALEAVRRRVPLDGAVLDAGAELYSTILPWLFLCGYRNLTGINLTFKKDIKRGPIRYRPGDITRMEFADASFDAVTCLSVIEHGVDIERYLAEASRVLKPGGLLVTSVDYFETPTDTHGQRAYGVPIRIFTREDVEAMIRTSASYGFELTSPLDLRSGERVVHWPKFALSYTFAIFTLRKAAAGAAAGQRPAA